MGALALEYARFALHFLLRTTALTLPVFGSSLPPARDEIKRAVTNPTSMSSSAIKTEPRGDGSLEDMFPPCEGRDPNHHSHPGHHHGSQQQRRRRQNHTTHGLAVSPNQRSPRLLPPPESLVPGDSSILHSHYPSPPPPTATPEERYGLNSTLQAARTSCHPPTSIITRDFRETVGGRFADAPASYSQEPWIAPPEALRYPIASQPTQKPPSLPPQPSPLHGRQRRLQGTEFHCDSAASRHQNRPPPGRPPNQAPRPPPHPSSLASQTTDGTPIPGMPNLLGTGRSQALSDIRFRLNLRQQPKAARACGFGDRDRRVIDPPPIVQLIIESSNMTEEEISSYLRYESYVMNCSICDESGTRDASLMPEEYQHQRRLMGSLVGTPFVGQDENGEEGCFFCFGDLSCRTPGAFRLKFTLIMIDPIRAGMIRHFPILTETLSDVFHVYSAKEFPGMLPSSNLAKRLKEQGCIISIKKGNERSRNSRAQVGLSDVEDEEGEGSQTQRRRHDNRE
ncbi:hypothetical protein HIM_01692 [Hirsutella minnesotensis 3608]|nr:hypothetical protein HIM_01692 [Hirsutella minnesotensis 3608]